MYINISIDCFFVIEMASITFIIFQINPTKLLYTYVSYVETHALHHQVSNFFSFNFRSTSVVVSVVINYICSISSSSSINSSIISRE